MGHSLSARPACLALGLAPSAHRRTFTYAALDGALRSVGAGRGSLVEVLSFVGPHAEVVAAAAGPSGPNAGLLAQPEYRAARGLPPGGTNWSGCRVAEYELRRRGLPAPLTPGPGQAPRAAQVWFDVHTALHGAGFQAYAPEATAARQVLEVPPTAAYASLLGHLPFQHDSLEGRLQRQIVLYDEGLAVADPLDAIEEVTRHHLRAGTLQLPGLLTPDELAALALAFTAHLAARRPQQLTLLGDPAEGQIALPVPAASLKEHYRAARS